MTAAKKAPEDSGDLHSLVVRSVTGSLNFVTLTKERIEEVVDDAVSRGRMTRSDANDLLQSLISRGRKQTEDLVAEIELLLERSRSDLAGVSAATRNRATDAAIKARRKVGKKVKRGR